MKRRTTICLVSIAVVVVFLGLAAWQSMKPDYGVGVDSVRWLPSEARNITYMKLPPSYAKAEFEIAQEVFEAWCVSHDMPLGKLGPGKEASISRCLYHLQDRGVIPVVPEPRKSDSSAWHKWYHQWHVKLLSGGDLYYEEIWPNHGGYRIGYDISEGMGYYWYAHN